ncbi:hypothetical protein [Alicyclobacillus fodiniaquatilis]|uniref:Aldo/keto reductase n=1 Tax=Alicyclobacillus fodiniaquatilis TaxID=1661150 RepID=A0ABW4JBP1_9BACL
MVQSIRETTTLNNGVEMPWFGLGVFQAKPEAVVQAVRDDINP